MIRRKKKALARLDNQALITILTVVDWCRDAGFRNIVEATRHVDGLSIPRNSPSGGWDQSALRQITSRRCCG